ncbi:Threonine/serine exporter family protein [Rhodovastum atsumiense]|uniref:Threonine/serine exporter family protein n=1 Tax=Rhodovastum atsumiense TaxID=504468 RepID=A0A5M6IT46_9PROT|nr:threonine/serine exporter family protein [Rhodovastum atsumiense]KAA5611494.1 threonine/serine exporter family protein [Rhodovastum atsumiense]CAH2601190.1 Threonine/serine exporter family protein [Rhodovastum atsumiense]
MPDTPRYDPLRHRDLEQIALLWLRCAKVLMQSGSRAAVVHEWGAMLADGLGVKLLGLRVGYASISITLGSGGNTITRMITVDRHGVNQRLNDGVRHLVTDALRRGQTVPEIEARLDALLRHTPHYPAWMVAVAVGLACAGFSRLLGADAHSFLPVLLAGGIGQYVRHLLLGAGTNMFVVATAISLLTACLGGLGAKLAGSATVDLAMFASTLLLVPGVAATNAQADVMDGYPTLGSARAVSVLMVMAFVATGIWFARILLGVAA